MEPSATSTPSAASLRAALIACAKAGTARAFLESLPEDDAGRLLADWALWARPDQLPPLEAQGGGPWSTWLVLGGRGAGKTRAGAEWVRGLATGTAPFAVAPVSPIALIAETTGKAIPSAASTFFAAGRYFAIDDLLTQARSIMAPDYYDRLALDRSLAQLETFLRRITEAMLAEGISGEAAVDAYVARRREEVERMRRTVRDIAQSGLSLSKLTLAASLLGDLVKA